MDRVSWTPKALRDLDRLEAFLWDKNQAAAARAISTITQAVDVLEQFPEAGRMVRGLDREHRELLVMFSNSGYVVHYAVHPDWVEILDVSHMREDRRLGSERP